MGRAFLPLALVLSAIVAFSSGLLSGENGGILAACAGSLLAVALILRHYSGALVLRLFRAQPADPLRHTDLYRMANELAQHAGLLPPRIFLVASSVPNAFATGRGGHDAAIAVTHGLLQLLERRELAGVLAHELAHLKQRKDACGIAATALSGSAALLAGLVRSAMIFSAGRQGPAFARATAPLAAVAAFISRFAASSTREFAADILGAKICGDPLWLADALRKLRSAGDHRTAAGLMSTHPPVAERIRRLEALAYGAYV